MAKETAEQKLLKLIEATDPAAAAAAAPAAPAAPTAAPEKKAKEGTPEKTLQSVKSVDISLPPFLKNITALVGGHHFGLKGINKVLPVCIVIVAVFFIYDFLQGMKVSKKEIQFAVAKNGGHVIGDSLPKTKDLQEYVNTISQRNIFHLYEKIDKQAAGLPAGQERITEKIVDLKLVGVSWVDTPDSVTVMIEDQKTSITHFLKEGEKFKGVKIDKIYADSIILSYENETITVDL